MTIRTWAYDTGSTADEEAIVDAVRRVFRSGQLILGPSVEAFEDEFAAYCGCRYGIGVANATDGLFMSLKALDVGPGDEVVTVSNTAVPTISAIVSTGAVPVFVDVDADTGLMDTSQLEGAITVRTRAVLPVHLFGQMARMEEVVPLAERHGLAVLEDCAQAHGARRNGARAGSLGHAGVYSFYPTKVLGACGDAGLVVTNDATLATRLRRLRQYGMDRVYHAEEHGYNSRLDALQAEILRARLPGLDGMIARRREIARAYDEGLRDTAISLPRTLEGNEHSFYLYAASHPDRDDILARLRTMDIDLGIHYPVPIHLMPPYRTAEGSLPVTERRAREVFSLPMYPGLSGHDQERVIGALRGM